MSKIIAFRLFGIIFREGKENNAYAVSIRVFVKWRLTLHNFIRSAMQFDFDGEHDVDQGVSK